MSNFGRILPDVSEQRQCLSMFVRIACDNSAIGPEDPFKDLSIDLTQECE